PSAEYREGEQKIPGLREAVAQLGPFESPGLVAAAIELVLEGLHLHQKLNKARNGDRSAYRAYVVRMLAVRHTACGGTPQVGLRAEQAFDKLSEFLSFTDDVQQARDWVLHQGLELEGIRVFGLDVLLEQLRDAMRARYRDVNLRGALAEL